jgi:aminopeptidase-like protein
LFSGNGGASRPVDQLALLHVLNFSDGAHALLDIAERSNLPFHQLERAARALQEVGLLAQLPQHAKESS